ncbi:hypothetical protein L1987_10502 [Smallanthus sonchifolius]|uniref:Uncharacterized protein n=1 Tax=Smallanthus sonchifolius TaxID=185202 RepID=A0ACB9JS98_9ASTR|nr:hypothetical protein L1987_10502 [Smallanthus sonchifolius]
MEPVSPFEVCYAASDVYSTPLGPAVPTIDPVMHSEDVFWRILGVNSMGSVNLFWCITPTVRDPQPIRKVSVADVKLERSMELRLIHGGGGGEKRDSSSSDTSHEFVTGFISFLIGSSMVRGRGKGKKFTLTNNNDDPASGEDEKIPSQKRRGRPQKPLMEEVEEDVEKIEAEEEYDDDDDDESANSYVNGKKKRNNEGKEKGKLVKEESPNGTRSNGFRHIGSRRKNKPHRAAEVGVKCK